MSKSIKSVGMILGGLLVIGLIGFMGIQFVPVNKTNPPVVSEPKWDSPQTQALAERACYDCHSNQTKWAWYSNIAPFSWYVVHDVKEGRAALNFSDWRSKSGKGGEANGSGEDDEAGERNEGGEREGGGRRTEGENSGAGEMIETISDGKMPPKQYLLLHPEARLSDAEIQALIAGLKATFGSGAEGAMTQ